MDIDKKVILINGTNTDNITINIEPIKNVLSLKHIETSALLTNPSLTDDLKTVYIFINDYNLKTLYDTNKYKTGIPVFGNLTFKPSTDNTKYQTNSINSGIITDFKSDNQNYVFNPMLGELNRLNISFKSYNADGELVPIALQDFSMELCIYTSRTKLTML